MKCICGKCNFIITDYNKSELVYSNNIVKKKAGVIIYNRKLGKIIIVQSRGNLWGFPKGSFNKDLSLKPICENLGKKINRKIRLIKNDIFELNRNDLFSDPNEQVIFLENIRFYEEEEKNDTNFSKHLSNSHKKSFRN